MATNLSYSHIECHIALSERAQLFGQFFRQNTPSIQPGLFPLSGLAYENGSTLAMLRHSWSLSPSAVNSLRFGFLLSLRDLSFFLAPGADRTGSCADAGTLTSLIVNDTAHNRARRGTFHCTFSARAFLWLCRCSLFDGHRLRRVDAG